MRFLPIVERELRVASRRRGTYWLRSWVALVVVLVSAGIFLFSLEDAPREIAKILFYTLTSGALLYCLLAGLRDTADCISEEKREGTLGLLFLTDLKGYDVVLGKLVANALNGFYGLLAILPVLGIPLLMGGITPKQVARVALVLVNTIFFSMCLGIFASASSRSTRRAIMLTFFLVLIFTAGFPALAGWLAWKFHSGQLHSEGALFFTSPVYSYVMAQDGLLPLTNAKTFYWSVGVIHGLAWVFLGLACLIVPRSWQDRPAGVRRLRWRERWKLWGYGNAAQRYAFRARLLDHNAFFWLTARARLKPVWVWLFLAFISGIWAWGIAKFQRDWFTIFSYLATAVCLNSILKNWLASEAARQLSEERKMGSLELLLSTPLTVPEILHGQALALRRQFLAPVLVTLMAELLMLISGMRDSFDGGDRPVWIAVWTVGMITLVADLIALYWVGMWMGLAAKNPKRAYSDTVGRVLALPWVGFAVFMTLVALISIRGQPEPGWKTILSVWFALSLATDFGFAAWARHKLLTEFRVVAAQRFQPRPSLLKRLFGGGANKPLDPE